MSLDTTLPVLFSTPNCRFKIDQVPDGTTWRATLGNADAWLIENAALTSAADVDAWFKSQAPIYFPGIQIP